jgi:hypothetical protein
MIIPRRAHWYAVELPVPMLIALVPVIAVLFLGSLSALRELFSCPSGASGHLGEGFRVGSVEADRNLAQFEGRL